MFIWYQTPHKTSFSSFCSSAFWWKLSLATLCFHSVFCYNILFPYTQESCPRRVFLHSGVLGCCMIFVESQSSLLSHRLVNTDLSVSNSPMHSNHRFSTHLLVDIFLNVFPYQNHNSYFRHIGGMGYCSFLSSFLFVRRYTCCG